jgi:hypothetical protein
VNAFLADLFHFFETTGEQCQPVEPGWQHFWPDLAKFW